MGLFGAQLGGLVGGQLGGMAGAKLGNQQAGQQVGQIIGSAGGAAIPWFKKGGRVKRTGYAVVHAGEYILPKGVKPTKAQTAKVAKGKRRK